MQDRAYHTVVGRLIHEKRGKTITRQDKASEDNTTIRPRPKTKTKTNINTNNKMMTNQYQHHNQY